MYLPSAKPADAQLVERTLALCGDGRALQIASIARDKAKSADDRMRELAELDSRYEGFDSAKWGELLEVTSAAIRATQFWKARKRRKEWGE